MWAFPATSTCTRSTGWAPVSSTCFTATPPSSLSVASPTAVTILPEPSLMSHSRLGSLITGRSCGLQSQTLGNWEKHQGSRQQASVCLQERAGREGGREGTFSPGKPTARAPKLQVSGEGDGTTRESSSGRQSRHPSPVCARHGSAEPDTPSARSRAHVQPFKFAG